MSRVAVYKLAWRDRHSHAESVSYVVAQLHPTDPKFTDPKWIEDHPNAKVPDPYQHDGSELLAILSANENIPFDGIEVVSRDIVAAEAVDGRPLLKFGDNPERIIPHSPASPAATRNPNPAANQAASGWTDESGRHEPKTPPPFRRK